MILALLLSCAPAPTSLPDCDRLDGMAREDCRFGFARALVADPPALQEALLGIDDPVARDLLLLRLAVDDPARAGQLCQQVQTDGAIQKCRQVLGRPHLQSLPRAPQAPP